MKYTRVRPPPGEIKYNDNGVNLPQAKHLRSQKQEYKLYRKGWPRARIEMNKYILDFTSWTLKMDYIEITSDCP